MAMQSETISAGFPQQAPVDRSASGLQYQRYSGGLSASGQALGKGRQMVFAGQFSDPPKPAQSNLSGAQFGSGGNGRQVMNDDQEGEDYD